MNQSSRRYSRLRSGGAAALVSLCLAGVPAGAPRAADHTDAPRSEKHPRRDAQLTDFWSFLNGDRLVLVMSFNPFLGPVKKDAKPFRFASDVSYRFQIDNDSAVDFSSDPALTKAFGGKVVAPDQIREDLTLQIEFDNRNEPQLYVRGGSSAQRRAIKKDILANP